jgi:hypothetical protein
MKMAYELEGQLLEVCTCNILCPCWVGEDPDGDGTCDSVNTFHVERGAIDGVDVSGRTIAFLIHIPGNVLKGNWKVAVVVDDGATQAQADALVAAWSGKLGGPLADVASLVGEVISVERAPISVELHEGKGTRRVGSVVSADMEPYRGPRGQVTTLNETIFTTIPGAPAWVSKASNYTRQGARYGLKDVQLSDHNAIQGPFRFVA